MIRGKKAQVFTVDTAPIEVLRKAYETLLERHQQGRDDRHLGWFIANNADSVTVTLRNGDTITSTGRECLAAIQAYYEQDRRYSEERAR